MVRFADNFNDPFFIGFDHLIRRLEGVKENRQTDNFPPFNIQKVSDDHFVLEMAVAGMTEDDIDVTYKESTLTVSAKAKTDEKEYIHRGIAARSFVKHFSLADTIEIRDANLVNGMLRVELENVIPEEKKARKIAIGNSQQLLAG